MVDGAAKENGAVRKDVGGKDVSGKGTRDPVGCGESAGDSAARWRSYTST